MFVSPRAAAALGWAWLGARAIYPWVYRLPGFGLFYSTVPAYLCVLYLGVGAVRAVL